MEIRKVKTSTHAGRLFNMSIESMDLLKDKEEISENGEIEVIIFSTNVTMFFLHNKFPDFFQKVQIEFEDIVLQRLHELGLEKKIPDVFAFLNKRNFQTTSDVKKLFGNDSNWLPVRIYGWFYTNPLTLDEIPPDDFGTDMFTLTEFQMNLLEIVGAINKGVKAIESNSNNLSSEKKIKNSENPSVQLLYLIIESTKIIEIEENLTTNGRIEVILFNANMARLHLHFKSPYLFKKIGREFDNLVLEHLLSLGLNEKVSDVNSFLNARTVSLNKEVQGMNSDQGWLPINIHDWFFINPLVMHSKPKLDLLKLITFQSLLGSMIGAVKEGVDLIIKEQ